MPADIRSLADTILRNPVTVQIGKIAPVHTVTHAIYPVSNDLKKELFFALLDRTATGRVLVFTRTKHRAKSLAIALEKRGSRVAALQGNLSQNRRQEAITGFRNGKYDILVATDIAARGIDVSEVTHVINFDMPDTADAYTHRIGRTGRAERSGDAFTIVVPEDKAVLREIEKVLGAPIERRQVPDFNYGAFVPERELGADRRDHRPAPGKEPQRAPAAKNQQAIRNRFVRRPGAKSSNHAFRSKSPLRYEPSGK